MSVPSSALQAGLAYRQAVEDAGNAVDQMMMQYGWQMPGAGGQYSTTAAGDAYDPDKVLQFDDQGKAIMTMPTAGGQYGTTGLFAQSAQETAAEEAEARLGARVSGITGGLARQRERLSETLGAGRMGALSGQLFAGLGQQYGTVRGAYGDVLSARATDATTAGTGMAENVTLTDTSAVVPEPPMAPAPPPPPPAPPSWEDPSQYKPKEFSVKGRPGDNPGPPKNPNEVKVHRGPGGIIWLWRPSQKAWFKKP
jgi:hypothetical protein